jgi:hypothetical protein
MMNSNVNQIPDTLDLSSSFTIDNEYPEQHENLNVRKQIKL